MSHRNNPTRLFLPDLEVLIQGYGYSDTNNIQASYKTDEDMFILNFWFNLKCTSY